MKKKFLCLLLSLAACGTIALGAVGCKEKEFYFDQDDEQDEMQEPSNGLKYSLIDYGKSYCVTGIEDSVGENVIIPSSYNGKPVTEIGEDAFKNCTAMKSITIPESLKVVGVRAFEGCDRLRAVKISDLAAWCEIEFDHSNPLSMAHRLYLNDEEVTELKIPEGVKRLNDFAFQDCLSIESVTIPESVTSIGVATFMGCHKLVEFVNLSHASITIGWSVLDAYDNTNFESKIKKQDGFVYYEGEEKTYLLDYLGDKTEITLPEKFNGKPYSIKGYAFYGRENLKSIIIPDSVTEIGQCAFQVCEKLENVETGNGVTEIGGRLFKGDVNLKTVAIGSGVTTIGEDPFEGCDRIQVIKISDLEAWCRIDFNYSNPLSMAHRLYLNDKEVTELNIPEGVDKIRMFAFQGCTSIESVTIPESVMEIGWRAFQDCTNLKSITISKGVIKISRASFGNCTALESATFKKTEGWTINGKEGDVTDPKKNAENLKGEMSEFDWENE